MIEHKYDVAVIDLSEYYLKRRSWANRFFKKIFKNKDGYKFLLGKIEIDIYLNKKGGIDLSARNLKIDQIKPSFNLDT